MVFKKIADLLQDYKRVLSVARKPTTDDMKEIIRICGLGVLIIGMMGFVFFLVFALLGGY